MAYQKAAELAKPCVGSFDDLPEFVATRFAPIFITPEFVVFPVGRDQLNGSLFHPFPQWVRVVGPVGDQWLWLLPRAAFVSRGADFGERGFRKRSFFWRGTFKPISLQPFAIRRAQQCAPDIEPNVLLLPLHQPPPTCGRRWRLVGQKSLRRYVDNTHRMASRQAGFNAHERPRLSRRRLSSGNSGSIKAHCASVNQQLESLPAQTRRRSNRPPQAKVPGLRPNLFMKQPLGSLCLCLRCTGDDLC